MFRHQLRPPRRLGRSEFIQLRRELVAVPRPRVGRQDPHYATGKPRKPTPRTPPANSATMTRRSPRSTTSSNRRWPRIAPTSWRSSAPDSRRATPGSLRPPRGRRRTPRAAAQGVRRLRSCPCAVRPIQDRSRTAVRGLAADRGDGGWSASGLAPGPDKVASKRRSYRVQAAEVPRGAHAGEIRLVAQSRTAAGQRRTIRSLDRYADLGGGEALAKFFRQVEGRRPSGTGLTKRRPITLSVPSLRGRRGSKSPLPTVNVPHRRRI